MSPYLKNKDIIVFGLQPWDIEIGSNCKSIASELAKNNRILYVNRPLDRTSLFKFRSDPKIKRRLEARKRQGLDIYQELENLWVLNPKIVLESVARIPFDVIFDYLNRINNSRLAGEINSAISELQFSEPVIFIDNEFYRGFYLKEKIKNQLFIYYIRDFLVDQSYFKYHGRRLEKALISKADLVVSNSEYLADYARKHNPLSYFIGQGCDLSLFDPSSVQEVNLPNTPKMPVVGYVGALTTTRLDLNLIKELILRKKDWLFVFVGPMDKHFESSGLSSYQNALFLGPKPKKELAGYISAFDVCINPQIVNQQTLGNYPLKIDEYLSMGKPVVATKTPAMRMFSKYVYLCDGIDQYIENINRAIDSNSADADDRIRFARSHTWASTIDKMNHAIEEMALTSNSNFTP